MILSEIVGQKSEAGFTERRSVHIKCFRTFLLDVAGILGNILPTIPNGLLTFLSEKDTEAVS